jgi:pyruvate formate lyase activating enzyme
MGISRRDFLKISFCSGLVLYSNPWITNQLHASVSTLKEASFYHQSDGGCITCDLCYHACNIEPGGVGICRSRMNREGKLYSLTYNCPVAIHIDPIGKIPMRHVNPALTTLSIATAGCTFSCLYCINHEISQAHPSKVEYFSRTPEELIAMAIGKKIPAIAFTYNEPTVAYEYMYEAFSLAKKKGLKTFIHTNGYMKPEPLKMLLSITDGVAVDMKAFNPQTHYVLAHGDVTAVQSTLKLLHKESKLFEVVTLLVPGYNDGQHEIKDICGFVRDELSSTVPLHFSRFFPKHKMSDLPPTSSAVIQKAVDIARRSGIEHVYASNIDMPHNDTYCHRCGRSLVTLQGIRNPVLHIVDGNCPYCGNSVPGIWDL